MRHETENKEQNGKHESNHIINYSKVNALDLLIRGENLSDWILKNKIKVYAAFSIYTLKSKTIGSCLLFLIL